MRHARLTTAAAVSVASASVAILTPTEAAAATTTATPSSVAAGAMTTFAIRCSGSPASATLTANDLGLPGDVTMVRTSTGRFALTVRVPGGVRPGPYDIGMRCSNGDVGTVSIRIAPRGAPAVDRKASSADMTTAVVGGGVIALAAVGGAILLGKRQGLDSDD